MKRRPVPTFVIASAVALVVGVLIGRGFRGSSASPASGDGPHEHASSAAPSARPVIWTCSMHPQIRRSEPGRCPICAMELVPATNETGDRADGARTLTLSESARALAEIETSPVVRAFPEVEVRLVGRLDFDETRLKSLTARFPARIDRLFVNYTGIGVQAGDHLAVIYSPDLLTAQREMLTAVQYDPTGATAQVARDKLRLLDLQPDQIDAIVAAGVAQDHFELRAPMGGIVVQKNVKEGDYVKTGDPLFRIADLSHLWLTLDAYESDLPWLRYGQDVAFEVESAPGERFEGRIVFVDPVLDNRTRTVAVRVEVPNLDRRLKPGMLARAVAHARVASGGRVIAPELAGKWISPMHPEIIKDHPGKCDVCGMDLVPIESVGYVTAPESPLLLVPASAVLRTGKRAVVYVALPDRDRPTYEGREIVLGPRAGERFVVLEGLDEGDEVVTRGAFKIDSALQIVARPSMMNPPEVASAVEPAVHGNPLPTLTPREARALLGSYLQLQAALAGDDFPRAREAIRSMMEAVGHEAAIAGELHAMLDAGSLEGIRRPHFDVLSAALVAAIRADASASDRELHWMHCPMVYPDHGADWLQADGDLRNPYFGADMLVCGEEKGVLGPGAKDGAR